MLAAALKGASFLQGNFVQLVRLNGPVVSYFAFPPITHITPHLARILQIERPMSGAMHYMYPCSACLWAYLYVHIAKKDWSR